MNKYKSLKDALAADEFLTATVAKHDLRALLADLEAAEKALNWIIQQHDEGQLISGRSIEQARSVLAQIKGQA